MLFGVQGIILNVQIFLSIAIIVIGILMMIEGMKNFSTPNKDLTNFNTYMTINSALCIGLPLVTCYASIYASPCK